MSYDCIVVGGGAAGLMAAYAASAIGKSVLIIEKNKLPGKKLMITGKGRCNVTNNCDIQTLMANIPTNPRFLYSAFNAFSPSDTMKFFEERGVALKTERGNRVFPVSDRAEDIVSALTKAVKANDVTVINDSVTSLIIDNDTVAGVKCGEKEYAASDGVIIATGGKSYPQTGSTGDGYLLAKQAGHSISDIRGSLVPICIKERYCVDMMGLSLKNVALKLIDTANGKELYSEQGEMLFTHFGVSGPMVLSASCHIKKMESERYRFEIDLKPALDENVLDKRILKDFTEFANRDYINSLGKLLPTKMIPVVAKLSEIPFDRKVNSITREERMRLIKLLKAFPLTVTGFRPVEEAIITSGGVNIKEIDPKTMHSKLVKGLSFAGEVIDVDAYTGGFNLQIAFSTGYLAGMNI